MSELTLETLADIALGLARAEELWRPHVRHDPQHRTAVRLLATDAYDVWLLGWMPGQRSTPHDHGDAHSALVVLEGLLEDRRPGGPGSAVTEHPAGDLVGLPAGTVHDLVNPGPLDAVSLHVYGGPVRTLTYYGDDGAPIFAEDVTPRPSKVDHEAAGRPLHPALRR